MLSYTLYLQKGREGYRREEEGRVRRGDRQIEERREGGRGVGEKFYTAFRKSKISEHSTQGSLMIRSLPIVSVSSLTFRRVNILESCNSLNSSTVLESSCLTQRLSINCSLFLNTYLPA